jgi:hypothetical protein
MNYFDNHKIKRQFFGIVLLIATGLCEDIGFIKQIPLTYFDNSIIEMLLQQK